MGIQINGATDSITAIDGTIDVVSAIGNAGVLTATAFVGNITGNVTGNINHTSNLELQVGGVTRATSTQAVNFHQLVMLVSNILLQVLLYTLKLLTQVVVILPILMILDQALLED